MSDVQASFRNSIVSSHPNTLLKLCEERISGNTVQKCSLATIPKASFMFSDISVDFPSTPLLRSRLLPDLAKHVILTMLYNPEPVSLDDFDAWFDTDVESRTYDSLHSLTDW